MTQGTPSWTIRTPRLRLQIPTTTIATTAIMPILIRVRLAGGATRTDEADGQVDLAEDEGEGFRHGEHHDHGALLEQVDQVDGRQVHVVGADGLEHDHDDDHRQNDRQDAAVARADARHVSADVFAERLGD